MDAQSEACKAYIASQAGLGWSLRDKHYDDGGISGGHMDRPALQELIRDIKAGLIDVIVVYKVDRLTRSLTDFSRLVDVFDKHDVSFVSVTQAFNTTTSMGRLTLNVLLSFAQFEREVTAERIRDKIAASKKKGMWMGGTCPFGYRNKDRKIYIVNDEAEAIRTLYNLYIELKNVRLVKAEADKLGLVSRYRTHKSGKQSGGKPFTRSNIYRILSNPIYIGQIQHKDKVYDGEHEAIIDKARWDQVQSILKANASKRSTVGNSKSPTLLAGLLFDADDNKLVPHHVNKKGTRYHYYVTQKLKTGDQDSGWRIPAKTIERTVRETLIGTFASRSAVLQLFPIEHVSADKLRDVVSRARGLEKEISDGDRLILKSIYNELIETIIPQTDQISITFKRYALGQRLGIKLSEDTQVTLTKPMTIRRRGQEMKMVIGGIHPKASKLDDALVKLISKAHALKIGLEDGSVTSIKDFAQIHNIDHADAKRMLPLGYLAPDIVEGILNGQQPEDLTALALKNGYKLPVIWAEQRVHLGIPAT